MAVSEWDKQYLSPEEQKKIADVTAAAQAGTMTWADAHAQAEGIRNQHQYSGGAKGNQYQDLTGGMGGTTVATPTAPATTTTPSAYQGTNYHQDAINAAQAGDWDAVNRYLGMRDAKTLATGQNYGKTSDQIYSELWAQYGGESAVDSGDVSKYLKDMYAQQTAAQLAALKSTYEQNVADVEANVPKINEMYQAARNETAAQSEIDKRNFAEYANARALNTGTSGQAELARQVSLTGNLAGISGQEKNALAENELQKQQLTIAYRNAIDEATAQGNAALAQALYGEYVRQIDFNNQQAQLDREYASNLAYSMLQAGIVPDTDTLSTAGIGATDANAIAAYYKQLAAQQAVKKASSGGGGGGGGNMKLSAAKEMAENGHFTDDVIAAFKREGYDEAYLADVYGYDPNATVQEEASAAGINESRFNQLGQAVNQYLAQGMGQKALDYLNGVWETLNRDQQDRIKAQFNRYGIVIE